MKLKRLSLFTFTMTLLLLVTVNVKAAGFNVTRKITGVATPVTNTFTYTVTADSSNPASVTIPSTMSPKTIAFSSVNPSSGTATQTASPLIADTVFTGITYSKPGTYKFNITESSSSNATLYPRDTNTYVVTVFVENNLNTSDNTPDGTFSATYIGSQKNGTESKVLPSAAQTIETAAGGRAYLSVTKKVTGNTADVTKCFKMTVNITEGGIAGEEYVISGPSTGACTSSETGGQTSATKITIASGGSGSGVIYLKHNQTYTIGKSGSYPQIPVGAKYTITEDTASASGYTPYVNGSSTSSSTTGSKTVSQTQSSNNHTFVNDKTETAPTGIILRTLPFVVLIVLSVVGVVAITKNKKLEENEE